MYPCEGVSISLPSYAVINLLILGNCRLLPKTIQLVLFSATFSDSVVSYANKFAPNSNQLTLKHEELTVEGIKQLYLDCDSDKHKYDILVKLYGLLTIGSSIIFVKVIHFLQTFSFSLFAFRKIY